jgi:hypothetical protein
MFGTILVIAALNAFPALADTSYGELTGSRSFIFSEGACFHEAPSESSAVVCSPFIGTPVYDLMATDIQHTEVGELTSAWMEGACMVGGERLQGYIPLSRLALTSQELGADTLMLFGVKAMDSLLYCRFIGIAKVVSDGRMLWGVAFDTPSGFGETSFVYGVSSEMLEPAGLRGVEDLMRISFVYEACGYENRDVLLAWTGWHLVSGVSASRVSEAGLFHYTEEILLPGDDPLYSNTVRIASTSEEYDGGSSEYIVVETDTVSWMWTGFEFVRSLH